MFTKQQDYDFLQVCWMDCNLLETGSWENIISQASKQDQNNNNTLLKYHFEVKYIAFESL